MCRREYLSIDLEGLIFILFLPRQAKEKLGVQG
jgi:hypothetical protein